MGRLTDTELTALRAVPVTADRPNRLAVAMALAKVDSQETLAVGTDLSQATISDILNFNYSDLKFSSVQRICAYLGTLVDDVFPNLFKEAA